MKGDGNVEKENLILPGGVVSMSGEAAGRLVSAGSGDAALLYLALLHRGGDWAAARRALRWTRDRLLAARDRLAALGLTQPGDPPAETDKPEPDEPPQYTAADIAGELESGSSFPDLVTEVQRRLGKVLSATDLRILFTAYDYLALPADVILLLVTWCVRQTEEKYGAGRKPTLPQIRSEAFRWKRAGADTLEAAEEHIKQTSRIRRQGERLLPLLGIRDRSAVEGERRYLNAWAQMSFEDDAIRLAYERTVLRKQSMNWPYMNSILKSWHQKGLHTVDQIRQKDSSFRHRVQKTPAAAGEADKRVREDMERMRRFFEEKKREEGGR